MLFRISKCQPCPSPQSFGSSPGSSWKRIWPHTTSPVPLSTTVKISWKMLPTKRCPLYCLQSNTTTQLKTAQTPSFDGDSCNCRGIPITPPAAGAPRKSAKEWTTSTCSILSTKAPVLRIRPRLGECHEFVSSTIPKCHSEQPSSWHFPILRLCTFPKPANPSLSPPG